MYAGPRTSDDGFEPSRRRKQQVLGGPRRMFRIVIGKRHAVKRQDFKRLSLQLQI